MDALPDNSDLEALFKRAAKHPADRPALLQALLESELYTLVPAGMVHMPEDEPPPDKDAVVVVEPMEGQSLEFIRWGQEGREFHFVYTSVPRAARALKALPRDRRMMILAMPGAEMLRAMHRDGVGLALNAASGGEELLLNDKIVEGVLHGGLLDGTALEDETERVEGTAVVLPPEDYPLALVQPLFEILRTRPEVMAAWVMQPVAAPQKGGRFYVFAVLTTTDETTELERLMRTVLTMVDAKDREGMEFGVAVLDYGKPDHAAMMRSRVPFYAAPDYRAPVTE